MQMPRGYGGGPTSSSNSTGSFGGSSPGGQPAELELDQQSQSQWSQAPEHPGAGGGL